MHSLTDRAQFQAQQIDAGRHKLPHEEQQFVSWISREFNVVALDFFCERKGDKSQLVHVILKTDDDVKKMQSSNQHAEITNKFIEYLRSVPKTVEPLKADVFPVDTDPFPKTIVTFRPVTGVSGHISNEMLREEQRAILKTFDSVWTISQSVIFYFTTEQITQNKANGTSQEIVAQLNKAAEKFGFTHHSQYYFDSKEIFDREYKGDWYYYWK